MGYAVRTRQHRYVEWRDTADGRILAQELYDHASHPQESVNLAGNSDTQVIFVSHSAGDMPDCINQLLTFEPAGDGFRVVVQDR